jgi:hypothetical protein
MFNDYVYELRDPDTLEVFYVGKGSDRRLEAHKPDNETDKGLKLDEIYRRGKEPLRIIIGRFENEEQAYAVEATLIKWVYGKNKLKNIIQGHRHKFIRPREQLIENQINEIEGIDAPPRDGMNIMRLVEYDKAIFKIREKSADLANAIDELVNHFKQVAAAQHSNKILVYRATETRLSFFSSEFDGNVNFQKRQPADPVARIFFKSPLNKGERLHLDFNRDPKDTFLQISNSDIHTKLGTLSNSVNPKKVDVILNNPSEWRKSEDLITDLLINSIKR